VKERGTYKENVPPVGASQVGYIRRPSFLICYVWHNITSTDRENEKVTYGIICCKFRNQID